MLQFPIYGVWSFGTENVELFDTLDEAESFISFKENGEEAFFVTTLNDKEEYDCFVNGPD